MNKVKIVNGKLITPYRIIDDAVIVFENGKITYTGKDVNTEENCEIIDAKGFYVSPGFIDIHTHGGGGHDFMDGTIEAYIGAATKHAEHGTTALVATTLTSTLDELKNSLEIFKKAKNSEYDGAILLGMHLEGPYFSMAQKGAQDPRYIKNPDPEEYLKILSWSDDILRWSAAPELDGAMEFGRQLKSRGILVSIAHSDAISSQVDEAFENGYTHATHLYSAMSGVRRINAFRYGGIIESAYLIDEMTVEIIADGVHLPAELLKLIYKIKGPSRTALVTDSMRAAGMPDGESILGSLKDGQKVIVEDNVAKLPDRSAFAGSTATTDRLVRNMIYLADVPVTDAVRMMTTTPASILGIDDRKGSLIPGKDADIVIFDENVNIKRTIVEGRTVFVNE
ncbi:MAG: N-acetylglucosamine-6-phosphate deacetylase [Clostridiaceae bacterium]|jgi:N-acetylglucosamine-6-phosphate deacetylase|nr:N-acetylglucosamine-6-phosphate deacetylase [Clostridiaceae bacterium]